MENNNFKVKRPHLFSKYKKYFAQDINEYKQMENKPVLFVRHLTKYYSRKKKPSIDNLSFNVYAGQFHAFIGANGAGKTTTIKSLIGAYYKWQGTVLIEGINNNRQEAKKKIGYIPETAKFPDKFSAREYLIWMVMLSDVKKSDAIKYADSKLKELKMWSLRHKSPNDFSSGQKKKILLAQALIHDPDLIIMDEPVANLDPKSRFEFFDQLKKLNKKGKAIFISSHVLAELDIYFDSATILDGGKIVYSGDKTTLLEKYAFSYYLIKLSSNENKLVNYLRNNKISCSYIKKTNEIHAYLKKQSDLTNVQKWCSKNNITILEFSKQKPTLEQVYKKLIVKGSVDTMSETTKK